MTTDLHHTVGALESHEDRIDALEAALRTQTRYGIAAIVLALLVGRCSGPSDPRGNAASAASTNATNALNRVSEVERRVDVLEMRR